MSKNPNETINPHILRLWDNKDNKNQDDLGHWRKAELKRRGEVMDVS